MSLLAHPYVLEPGAAGDRAPLLLLHGTYGAESDLLPLAARLAPGAPKLGVRGTVALENGFAFFRRHADRRVDEADLKLRVPSLVALVEELTARGRLSRPPVAVGFSNGAIMAAALVALRPEMLAGAVLLRPLSPFADEAAYGRTSVPVLVVDGAQDRRRSPGDGERLAERLSRAGAVVTHRVLPAGHAITAADEDLARAWLETLPDSG